MPMASGVSRGVSRHQFSKVGLVGVALLTAQPMDEGDGAYNTMAMRGEDSSELCAALPPPTPLRAEGKARQGNMTVLVTC